MADKKKSKLVRVATWPLRYMWHHKIMSFLVIGALVGTHMYRNSASRQAAEAEKAARMKNINEASYKAESAKIQAMLMAENQARARAAAAAKKPAQDQAQQGGGIVYRTDPDKPVAPQVAKPQQPAAPWIAPMTDKSPEELTGFEKVSNAVARDQAVHPELGGLHTVLVCDENNHTNYAAACFGLSVSRTTNQPKLYRFGVQNGAAPSIPQVNLTFADNPKIGFGVKSVDGEIKGVQFTKDDPAIMINPRAGTTLLWVNKEGEVGQEQDPAKIIQVLKELRLFDQGKGAKIKSQPFTIVEEGKQPQQTAYREVKTPAGSYYMPGVDRV